MKKVATGEEELLEESLEESKKTNADKKLQLEEAKRIYEVTSTNLSKREKEHQNLEEEIVKHWKELEKRKEEMKVRSKYEGTTKYLDKVLRKQKKSKDTGGLGFKEGQS